MPLWESLCIAFLPLPAISGAQILDLPSTPSPNFQCVQRLPLFLSLSRTLNIPPQLPTNN